MVLFVLPYVAALFLTGSWEWAFLAPLCVYAVFMLFSVWSISIDESGITFSRFWGRPKKLSWNEVQDISLAPRRELIWHGWLWPLLPAREMTASLSSVGHYRISWAKGYCYYPPADQELFEKLVAQYLKRPE